MDPVEVGWHYRSYVRRKKFEADVMANAVIGLLSVAMGGKAASTPAATTSEFQPRQRAAGRLSPDATPDRQVVPAHQFFKILESR
jgi:hypothetical protein